MADSSAPGDVVDITDEAVNATTAATPSDDQPIMTPKDIETLFASSKHRQVRAVISEDDEDDDEALLPEEELSWRVEQLSRVLSTLRKLLESGSTNLDAIAQKLGDGSRDGESMISVLSQLKMFINMILYFSALSPPPNTINEPLFSLYF